MRRTFLGTTWARGRMNDKREAQRIAVIRSPHDTRIGDAFGVEPEAPKGGKRSDLWERESGGILPARMASGSRRGD